MTISTTKHFRNRFKERVANTKRVDQFAEKAMELGKTPEDISITSLADALSVRENIHGSTAKVYKNYVYWFCGNQAITVYPLSQKNHERTRNE